MIVNSVEHDLKYVGVVHVFRNKVHNTRVVCGFVVKVVSRLVSERF